MGYEIKMLVGESGSPDEVEYEDDKEKPYPDGYGFERKLDERGNKIPTGRTLRWFQVMAMVDLCKLGYQDDALNRLITSSQVKASESKSLVYYFCERNDKIMEDCYGSGFFPVSVSEVVSAIKAEDGPGTEYRRLKWALALLESMEDDGEQLEVLFYGH